MLTPSLETHELTFLNGPRERAARSTGKRSRSLILKKKIKIDHPDLNR